MIEPQEQKNKILAKITVAAKTALAHPRNVELAHFIGAGPSIRARARLALAAAFLVAAPTLFIGVMRTESVSEHAIILSEYHDYWRQLLRAKLAVKDVDVSLRAYAAEQEFENAQAAIFASSALGSSIDRLVMEQPKDLEIGPKGFLKGLCNRLDGLIRRSIANDSSHAPARLSMITLGRELEFVEGRVQKIVQKNRQLVLGSLSTVARDQLILFLVLLFALPVFVGFIPPWIVAPLARLRQLARKLEIGQLRELGVSGRDEVAVLARSLKSFLLKKEELEHKKSSKIFELRNVLRSVLNRVNEPVFIVDNKIKINYTNEAASQFAGLPSHQMEGKCLSECFYAPVAKKAAEKAFLGDVSNEAIPLNIEILDGREYQVEAKIGVVRNRDGDVSRAVLVFYVANIATTEEA